MHDPDGSTPKPASTWGNAAGAALHNVYYRTPATPGVSLRGTLPVAFLGLRLSAVTAPNNSHGPRAGRTPATT